jgi:hypothetical protein
LAGEMPPAAKHDGHPDKPYVYKTSAGEERSMEIFFPLGLKSIEYLIAPNEGHGFFNQPDWHTVTLIAADDFLVKHGLLAGKATLTPRTSACILLREIQSTMYRSPISFCFFP